MNRGTCIDAALPPMSIDTWHSLLDSDSKEEREAEMFAYLHDFEEAELRYMLAAECAKFRSMVVKMRIAQNLHKVREYIRHKVNIQDDKDENPDPAAKLHKLECMCMVCEDMKHCNHELKRRALEYADSFAAEEPSMIGHCIQIRCRINSIPHKP